jgi:DNA-binding transcriptional regulator YdaS (Cro superfamily)
MDHPQTPSEALALAVEKAGSQAALARICGVSQPAVWKWAHSAKRLPPEHVLTVEAATGVSRHALRPDIYPLPSPLCPQADPNQADFDFLPAASSRVACDRAGELQRKDTV